MAKSRNPIPREIWIAVVIGGVAGLFTANPWLTLLAIMFIPFAFALLWRSRETPVLLFAVGYQWLQVSLPIFDANAVGLNLAVGFAVSNLDVAALLSFYSLAALALGMRVGRGSRLLGQQQAMLASISGFSVSRLLIFYVAALLVSMAALAVGTAIGGLRQPTIALLYVRWVAVFIILMASFTDSRFRGLAVCVFGLELAIGFLGYFSTFKDVLFIAVLAAVGSMRDFRRLLRPRVVVLVFLIGVCGIFWQAIKDDYRNFLNQGTRAQTVLVTPVERVYFLFNAALDITTDDIVEGFESGVSRTGYLEYFARVTTVVPASIPYQNGRLWGEATAHVLQPRFFFPEKLAINDSDRVNEFSGTTVAGADQGTSISLGYAAESYIDFGPFFLALPVFLWGVLLGRMFALLCTTGGSGLVSLGFAITFVLTSALFFEASNIKMFGGALSFFIGAWAILRLGSRDIEKFISLPTAPRAVGRVRSNG